MRKLRRLSLSAHRGVVIEECAHGAAVDYRRRDKLANFSTCVCEKKVRVG